MRDQPEVSTTLSDTAPTDELLCALVERLRRRDERALVELYEALASKAYGLALRVVERPQIAEEVVEDTFFQMWREADRFDPARGRVVAWMATICRSRALDALRKLDQAELTDDTDSLLEHAAAAELPPDRLLDQFEQASAVRRALERLPQRERQAVALSFFKGLSHQEIADQWQMPLGSVKTLLHRAFGLLRAELEPTVKTTGLT